MTSSNKPTAFFWVIAIIALIWNAMGVMAYLVEAFMTDEMRALLPEAEQAMYASKPAWATGAFAIAVFAGLLGSLALVMRKKWARPLFLISFVGIVAHTAYILFVSGIVEANGWGVAAMPLMVLIIGIFLIMYSKKATLQGWLN